MLTSQFAQNRYSIPAGNLVYRVVLQQRTDTTASGSTSSDWSTATSYTVWASVVARTGNTVYEIDRQAVQQTHEVVIRFRSGFGDLTKWRVSWADPGASVTRLLSILAAEPLDGRNSMIRLRCAETTGATS